MKPFALVTLLCLLTSPSLAYEVLARGVFCPSEADGQKVEAPGTELGWVRESTGLRTFDVLTDYVPADTLLGFGVVWQAPLDPGATTGVLVLSHPPLGDQGITRQEQIIPLRPSMVQGSSWVFEFDYEKVQGLWKRSLEVNGKTVWSEAFTVGPAGSSAAVNIACFTAAPMS